MTDDRAVQGRITDGSAVPRLEVVYPPPAKCREDVQWAWAMYEAFARGGDDEQMVLTVMPGNPWSKSRPRFARGRTYQPRDDLAAEQALRLHLRGCGHFTGNVFLACHFFRANYQRIDADNLLKHVCDSAIGALWTDDSQVTAVVAVIDYDPDNPRTVIVAGNHDSTLARGSDQAKECAACGELFIPSAGKRRVEQACCGRRCARIVASGGVDLSQPVPCAECGQPFKRVTSEQILCSRACRVTQLRGRPRLRAAPKCCVQCGAVLTHRHGGRCRACWIADPKWRPAE